MCSLMETSSSQQYTPIDLLLLTIARCPPQMQQTLPSTNASLEAWKKLLSTHSHKIPMHVLPIPLKALFTFLSDLPITHWHYFSITTLGVLYANKHLKTFDKLHCEHNIPYSKTTYAKITHFLQSSKLSTTVAVPESIFQFLPIFPIP